MKTRQSNNPILKNASVVAISMFTTRLIGAAKSFFLAKYLGPSDYGIWVTAMIVTVLANIGHLGVLEAIVKEVSSLRGKKEHEKIRDVECTALAGVIVLSICFGIICFVCIWALPGIHSLQQKLPFQLAIAASVVSFFTLFYSQRLASHELFIKVSIVESIKYSCIAVIATILALKYGVAGATGGLLAGELIGFISAFIANSKSFQYKLIPHFDYSGIWALVRVGFPITFVWWLLLFHTAIDRIVAITMLGKEATGYYGFGVTLTTLVLLVPTAFGRVLYPRIGKAVASEGSAVALKNLVIAPTRYMSMCTAALLCVICMGYPVVYKYITPQYWPGLPSAMILVVAVYFPTLTRNGANYLIATGKLNAFIKISLFSLLFNTVLMFCLFYLLWLNRLGLCYCTFRTDTKRFYLL
jgi:O-antigen/teichoic acid export membrane protein